jgi:thymidylate synthase
MGHTWQSDFVPRLAVADVAGGDVAVCGLFTDPDQVHSQLGEERISFVAPYRSRSDLDWILRGLHLHPNIRHLVVCGDDPRATGEALIALWEEGLDENGRLPGSRGRLSPEMDGESVDAIRHDVEIWDWRARSLAEVASGIPGLPKRPPEREARIYPDIAVPDRATFLSRKTTFPIFTSDVGDGWLQLLNLVMRIGTEKKTSQGERIAEALNAVVTIELPATEGDPAGFLEFNAGDFDRYYRRFTSSPSEGESLRGYGDRLRDWDGIDQLEAVSDRLKKSLDTRSGTLVLLGADDLSAPQGAPSVISATFNVVDQRLFGSFVLRSLDVYTDWPFEALALVRLQYQVAQRLGIDVATASFVVHSAHLYERDWHRAQRALDESFKRPLPLQVDPSGIFLFGNDEGKARAMLLDHGASTIYWEEAFGDPEDLSWYIIDVMPWLLPQHIRYVGQECASLMRAIREGECYEQG